MLLEEPAGGRAAWGLADTLRSLSDGRVMTLVVLDDYRAAGASCGKCGLMAPEAEPACPGCGEPMVPVDDVVDVALERAYQQSATLELVRSDEARVKLETRAPIAALLRY